MNSFPLRKFTAVSLRKISLKVLLLRLLLGSQYCLQLVATRDYVYCLQSHHRPVNNYYLSTAVQLTNRLLPFWADGGFVYYKRVSSPSSRLGSITSWFAIALDEIRTIRILREKADCKQSNPILVYRFGAPTMATRNQQKHLEFTFVIKALSFHLRTSIHAHKHIF